MDILASIKIYDLSGRQVAHIAQEATYTKGNHKVHFDGTTLPQGLYFVELQTNQYNRVAKIIKI